MSEKISSMVIIISLLLGCTLASSADDRIMLHDECIQLIFNRLQIGEPGKDWISAEIMTVFKEADLQPRAGFKPGEQLDYGQLADLFVKLYAIDNKLPPDYTESDAILLLFNEGIFPENQESFVKVSYETCAQLIEGIPITDEELIIHEEFVHHLFDRLDLADRDAVLSVTDKIESLKELNFQPREGYRLGKQLLYGEMAVVFVRLYGIEDRLNRDYFEMNAIDLLIEEGIFKERFHPFIKVPLDTAVARIHEIPRAPGYGQKTVLLPRFVREPPMSRCE